MKIKINKKINEMSSMGASAVQGHVDNRDELDEMYSSAGIMGMGSGRIPADRSPEGHERYVRMRHDMQGLKNFKQNRYFAENKEERLKIKIKIKRNLEERCQKGYKTHPTRKTKKMFGKTYRNCVKAEAKDAVSKSHKRQSQIINLVHQRVRAAYQNAKDPEVKKRLKKAFDYAKKRKEASKKKTQRMKKDK
jgi:hypothetical protein